MKTRKLNSPNVQRQQLNAQIESLQMIVTQKDNELNTLKATIASKDSSISQLNSNNIQSLNQKNAELDSLKSLINNKDNIIAQLNNSNSQSLAQSRADLSAKTAENNLLRNEIENLKRTISNLEQSLKQKDQIIDMIAKNLEDARQEKVELKNDKAKLHDKLSLKKGAIKEKDLEIECLKKELAAKAIKSPEVTPTAAIETTTPGGEDDNVTLSGDTEDFVVID